MSIYWTVYSSCLAFSNSLPIMPSVFGRWESFAPAAIRQCHFNVPSAGVSFNSVCNRTLASPFQAFSQWGSKIACETITSGSRLFTFARPLFPSSPLPGLLTSLGYTPARVKQSHSPVSRSSNFVHHSNDYRLTTPLMPLVFGFCEIETSRPFKLITE